MIRKTIKLAFSFRGSITALGLTAFSSVVVAQSIDVSGNHGPSWEVIAVGTWGLLTTVIGVVAMTWTAAISSRVKDTEKAIQDITVYIRDNYHNRDEVGATWQSIERRMETISSDVARMRDLVAALHGRFDVLLNKRRGSDGSTT